MSEVACKTKSMSTPDNLIEAAQTTLLQAKGLDKLDRLTTPTLVKATTLDIGRHLFVLGVLTDSSPSYFSCCSRRVRRMRSTLAYVSLVE